MRPMEATDLPEAIRENRSQLETGHAPAADDVFGAWEDDPDAWPELRRHIEESWPELDPDALEQTRGRPAQVVRVIGRHAGLDHEAATMALERVLRRRERERSSR